jgi:hypothetical protein
MREHLGFVRSRLVPEVEGSDDGREWLTFRGSQDEHQNKRSQRRDCLVMALNSS